MIYKPAEDSYLMKDILKKELPNLLSINPNLKILEVGIGSGIQLQTLKEIGVKEISGVDTNPDAVEHCKELGFNCVQSDLFENVNNKYDIIIFNPPYLPDNKDEPEDSKIATTGGIKGSEIINKFLKQAKDYLNTDGKVYLITSSLTKDLDWLDWQKKLVKEKKLFFEHLYLFEICEKNFIDE